MAEPKKKIIIRKKKIIKKVSSATAAKSTTPAPADKAPPTKLIKTSAKKISVTKKKSTTATIKEAPPPEVISTSEIEVPAVERQKTMIAQAPIGAATHKDPKEPKEVFKFYCIRCGQKLEAYYDWVGRSIGCPRCKASIKIPEPLQ